MTDFNQAEPGIFSKCQIDRDDKSEQDQNIFSKCQITCFYLLKLISIWHKSTTLKLYHYKNARNQMQNIMGSMIFNVTRLCDV